MSEYFRSFSLEFCVLGPLKCDLVATNCSGELKALDMGPVPCLSHRSRVGRGCVHQLMAHRLFIVRLDSDPQLPPEDQMLDSL
jgi:hypothetical protein